MKSKGNRLFQESLSAITGSPLLGAAPPFPPLGGETWPLSGKGPFARELAELLLPLTGLSGEESARFRQILTEEIETAQTEAEELLGKTSGVIQNLWERLFAETSAAPEDDHLREKLAEAAGKLWLPELGMEDAEILQRWILKDPRENPHPLKPEEVVLQLNALYTEPEDIPSAAWEKVLKEAYQAASPKDRETQAEYDHPVPLFAPPKEHELEGCLAELEGDLAFEKDQGTLPRDHKMPVIVSVSLTHPYLDGPAERWLRELLKKEEFQHLRVFFLTEEVLTKCQSTLFQSPYPVFTVMGRYSRHFNTLKYAQLLMEKGFGIRGGFKLDTDEGIRSRELFESTGKTWLQTLCHPYWGGSARDWKDRPVVLGINEGGVCRQSGHRTPWLQERPTGARRETPRLPPGGGTLLPQRNSPCPRHRPLQPGRQLGSASLPSCGKGRRIRHHQRFPPSGPTLRPLPGGPRRRPAVLFFRPPLGSTRGIRPGPSDSPL